MRTLDQPSRPCSESRRASSFTRWVLYHLASGIRTAGTVLEVTPSAPVPALRERVLLRISQVLAQNNIVVVLQNNGIILTNTTQRTRDCRTDSLNNGWRVWPSAAVEDLRLIHRDVRVAADELCHDPTERLNTERQGHDIEKRGVSNVASEHTTLDGGTDGDSLIGVDSLTGLATEDALDRLGDLSI
jgi:hypothetical protein